MKARMINSNGPLVIYRIQHH